MKIGKFYFKIKFLKCEKLMKKNFFENLPRPILWLAPMAGFTESPFRRIVKKIEPSTILVSELISAAALARGNEKTLRMCEFSADEKKFFGIQIFGADEKNFLAAAKIVENLGADFLDLNFGCPSPKIVRSGAGSAILKNPDFAAEIIFKISRQIKIPVTAKIRLGFFSDENFLEICQKFADAGLAAISVHGRTAAQKFSGAANFSKIYELKNFLKIPVIGNGDIRSAADARAKIRNLDGIMIGRAAVENPWIFQQCREIFADEKIFSPNLKNKINFLREILNFSREKKSEKFAILEARKFFSASLRGFSGAKFWRQKILAAKKISEIEKIFQNFF